MCQSDKSRAAEVGRLIDLTGAERKAFAAEVGRLIDLTGAERKAFAAEVGRLITALFENSREKDDSQREFDWFREWREKSGIGQNTAYTWWSSFTKSAGLSITPYSACGLARTAELLTR